MYALEILFPNHERIKWNKAKKEKYDVKNNKIKYLDKNYFFSCIHYVVNFFSSQSN